MEFIFLLRPSNLILGDQVGVLLEKLSDTSFQVFHDAIMWIWKVMLHAEKKKISNVCN